MCHYETRKRVVVTSGVDILGSHLCDRLLARGHEVLCADNAFTGTKRNVEQLHDNPCFAFMRHDVTFPLHVKAEQICSQAWLARPRR